MTPSHGRTMPLDEMRNRLQERVAELEKRVLELSSDDRHQRTVLEEQGKLEVAKRRLRLLELKVTIGKVGNS